MNIRTVGQVGNYYGELNVKQDADKFYWSIENHNGHCWFEIPETLYRELMAHQDALEAMKND